MRIEKTPLLRILQIGIPAGIQVLFLGINVFIQSGINSFGENAIASFISLALNFEYFTYDVQRLRAGGCHLHQPELRRR